MRTLRILLVLLLAWAAAGTQSKAASNGQAQFEKLKSLAGEWQGKGADGASARITYKVVSGGSALMETSQPPNEPEMITVYHLDGDHLMMTHYCSSGNQPRMRAEDSVGNTIKFRYLDATNLSSPDAGHMHALTITWDDANHITQEWTWRQNGQDMVAAFKLERQK